MNNKQIEILKGWKEIQKEIKEAFGLSFSISTIRRISKQFNLPKFYLGNRPCISKENLHKWFKIIESASNMALEKLEADLLDRSNIEGLSFEQKLSLYNMLDENRYRGLNFLYKLKCQSQTKEFANLIFGKEDIKK